MSLCKYANMFGAPNTGVHHSFRLNNVAMVDVISTVIGAAAISYFTKASFVYVLLFLFLLGIILHRLFCVRTTVDIWLRKHFV